MNSLLAITLGDPHSINIELLEKIKAKILNCPFKVLLIGSHWQWNHQRKTSWPIRNIQRFSDMADQQDDSLFFYDIDREGLSHKPPVSLRSSELGYIAKSSLEAVIPITDFCEDRNWPLAVLTMPINKNYCHEAGFYFGGQTEYFSHIWSGDSIMILAGPKLIVGLVTNHLPLQEVPKNITKRAIGEKLQKFSDALKGILHRKEAFIGVCGLNPHCGDGGLFGEEEALVITDAISENSQNLNVTGPIPADTAFYRGFRKEFDGILAMYHDQGLGPLKTVHFDEAVNLTAGLKHLRISPDHGPAKDLFGQNIASSKSVALALTFCKNYLEKISGSELRMQANVPHNSISQSHSIN